MPNQIRVGPPIITINQGGTFMVTDMRGEIDVASEPGLFAGDTRFVSSYAVDVNGEPWRLLSYCAERLYFTNPAVLTEEGGRWPHSAERRGDMPMTEAQLTAMAERLFDGWNRQDVEAVVACYADDLVYRDPNTRGEVKGRDAMRRYLRKLFGAWQMHWALRELFPLADADGAAALWHASFRKPGGERTVEADGMDLVLMDGELVKRNEVYFDRAVLAPLLG